MDEPNPHMEASWKARLGEHFRQPEMGQLSAFLHAEKTAGKTIYPPGAQMFAAFDHTPFDAVKVVILGQDPYHGPGQAHGLSFSVRPGVRVPPSLTNVFAEIERDLGITPPDHGCLLPWAERGVLLLNSVLSVERGQAASHRGRGWEGLTDAAVTALSREREGLVFLLWGSQARAKGKLVDAQRHRVLHAPHPSPLSAHRGFHGCGHFSAANAWLDDNGLGAVDWSLPARALLADPG